MKTNQSFHVCGSIIKKESIFSIKSNIAPHTCVAEAISPYSDYYGRVPQDAKPNSLFLITKHIYMLEEALRFARKIDMKCMEKINVAVSFLIFPNNYYPSIRIKYFPDYNELNKLQECFMEQGVEFAKTAHLEKSALIKTNKCFVLEEIEDKIYFDKTEKKTGYISLEELIDEEDFGQIIAYVKNNSDFPLFDAARGTIILNSKAKDIVRIYSEKMDISLLKFTKNIFEKMLK